MIQAQAECRVVHDFAGELVKLTESQVARDRIERQERTICKPLAGLLEQDFVRSQQSLKAFRTRLEEGQADIQAGQKAREDLSQLNKRLGGLVISLQRLIEIDQIHQTLVDLAAGQARQSTVLKAARAKCEADLLGDLPEKP
jgi:hypothetical protein